MDESVSRAEINPVSHSVSKKKKKRITSVLVMSAVAQWKTWQFLTPSAVVQGHRGGHWNEEQKKKDFSCCSWAQTVTVTMEVQFSSFASGKNIGQKKKLFFTERHTSVLVLLLFTVTFIKIRLFSVWLCSDWSTTLPSGLEQKTLSFKKQKSNLFCGFCWIFLPAHHFSEVLPWTFLYPEYLLHV